MTQYFQLTPEILLEYVYSDNPKINSGKGNIKDIYNDYPTLLLKSNMLGSKFMCFKNDSEGLDSFSNLVLPLNNSETQFVIAENKYQRFFSKLNPSNVFSIKNNRGYIYEDTNYDNDIIEKGDSCAVNYDKCIVHFTSRNYFENYNSLIFQAHTYMNDKSKLYLASFLFKRTSNLEMKTEHMIYNEKLYTTQIEFDIPSVYSIFVENNKKPSERSSFVKALKSQGVELLKNTPIVVSIYGVNSSITGIDNYERLKVYKLNSVSVPYIYNRFDEICVNISEATDGDYYIIDPDMGSKNMTFVEYIESMGEDIRAYIIMHEVSLRETWVDINNIPHSKITHKEQHIINIYEDDEDEEIDRKVDAQIKFRPICVNSGTNFVATIIDTIKIINTVDSSSYEVTGSLDIKDPHKYGKKLKAISFNESRPIINVYNKRVVDKTGGRNTISLNRGGGFVVENKSQNVTSFMESINIGVSIVELSPGDIELTLIDPNKKELK